ncbi:PTS alpha-glucoside transporter subunit IIBC [Clostridioides difficile]|uniref:alpha-glucoside-specific PTS transporter subunit IIBC n=1 Tax=Clostridioides difficile TaxID=1496 RepID=UPI000C2BA7A2|nr:alpha-glucoside-specific PTS transporter subunit IIBC [Clostridioides difficile]AUA30296.1 PTS alpha-glucoside transporter subunit IIBC [Clostridioides difficile]
MMKKIQRFGGAMFTPTLLFAFAGIMVGFSIVFQNQSIMGSLATPENIWYQFWGVISSGAWMVFNQLPLLFAISLPIALAKKQQARACMEALATYLTFNYFVGSMLSFWGKSFGVDFAAEISAVSGLVSIAGIKTLDTGMVGALLISGIVIYIHNRFYDKELPDFIGLFRGSSLVVAICFFVMIPVALLTCFIWPHIQNVIRHLQTFFINSGNIGVWCYAFLQKILIPTGLHHFVYAPICYDSVVVPGGTSVYWATHIQDFQTSAKTLKEMYPIGFSLSGLSKVFGSLGVFGAFYVTAKPEKKKKVLGLMIPATLTAVLTGITEPLEFTFLFVAPLLFLVHAFLDACLQTISFALGVVGDFGGGIINWVVLNWLPLGMYHWKVYVVQVVVGIIFSFIWFFVFTFLIKKFDMKTPGREEDSEETKLYTKNEYLETKDEKGNKLSKASQQASEYIKLVGGAENVVDVTNCATRLRLTLKDDSIISKEEDFKAVGAHGLVHNGKAIQIIIGLSVPSVREEFENLL